MDYNIDKSQSVLYFAEQIEKKYNISIIDINVYREQREFKAKDTKDVIWGQKSLRDRIVQSGGMKRQESDILEDILSRNVDFDRGTLMQKPAEALFKTKKKKGKIDASKLAQYQKTLLDNLEKYRAEKKEGNNVSFLKYLRKQGLRDVDIDNLIKVQTHLFLRDYPQFLDEAYNRIKLERKGPIKKYMSIVGDYLEEKKVFGENKKRNIGAALGLLTAAVLNYYIWVPPSENVENNISTLPEQYQNVVFVMQYKSGEDDLDDVEEIMQDAYESINTTLENGSEEDKKKAQEYKRKLDIIKLNMREIAKKDLESVTAFNLSELEKKIFEE